MEETSRLSSGELKRLAEIIEERAERLLDASERMMNEDPTRALQGLMIVVAFMDSCTPVLKGAGMVPLEVVARALTLKARVLMVLEHPEAATLVTDELIRRFDGHDDPNLQQHVAQARVLRLVQGLLVAREVWGRRLD